MFHKLFSTYLKKSILFVSALVVGLGLALVPGNFSALADPPEPYLVKDINTTPGSSGDVSEFVNVNGILFFSGNDGEQGEELWKSDGSEAGTVQVKDIFPSSDGSSPDDLRDVNGTLFFTADDGVHGRELWKSDGSEAGTVLVKDIVPGGEDASLSYMTNANGTLFFTADDGVHGRELWKSDGSEAGTVLVKDIIPGGEDASLSYLTNVNGTLFFSADDGVHGVELWKSDGSEAGTVLVKDIRPGSDGSYPGDEWNITAVNGTLFFHAWDEVLGFELWKSDGSEAGTVLVKDINPGSGWSISWDGGRGIDVNGTLFFRANDGVHGVELWKSDGTESGPFWSRTSIQVV